jgi:hypothetical protein
LGLEHALLAGPTGLSLEPLCDTQACMDLTAETLRDLEIFQVLIESTAL